MNAIYFGALVFALVCGLVIALVTGMGKAIAAVITAVCNGKALLIRARRGDPESPIHVIAVPRIRKKS